MYVCAMHQVKFFERKKVTRNISKVEKQIASRTSQGENVADLISQKTALQEDLAVSAAVWNCHFF